jgi:hypothetical protein
MSEGWQPVKGRVCSKCGSARVLINQTLIRCDHCGFETDHRGHLAPSPEPLDVSASRPVGSWRSAMSQSERAEAEAGLELTKQLYREARAKARPGPQGILDAIDEAERVNPYGGLPQGDTGALVTARSSEPVTKPMFNPELRNPRAGDGNEVPITVPRPVDVVDLRADLVRFWEQDTSLTREMAMQGRYSESEADYWDEGGLSRRWMHGVLKDAELYWVSPDMCTLLQSVADSMPDVTPEPPIPEALVVFARPLEGMDAMSGTVLLTAAYLWGPVRIKHVSALEIETFGWRDLVNPQGFPADEVERFRHAMPTKLISTGGSEWPWQELTSDFATIKGHTAQQEASMAEDRRKLAAFWSLCQDRITVERIDSGPRAAQRRAARARLPLKPVRIITLRESAPKHPAAQGREVDWSHRWLVGAYWRQQPYGPGGSLRRAKLIPAHVKGPADKPFIPRDTVRALKR